jgi:protein-ribulosamine 3-kinase
MVHGEHESMLLIHKIIPSFSAKPLAWGACRDPDRHFILFTFHDLEQGLPSIPRLTFAVAQLHQLSRSVPRHGKFGFHITTYNGILAQDNTWTDTWEEFYIRGVRRMLALEEEVRGHSQELQDLSKLFLEKVVPRLLRPMETGGRTVEPVLIHGDLWIGNVSTQRDTGDPLVFDASAFWGHNECKSTISLCPAFGF